MAETNADWQGQKPQVRGPGILPNGLGFAAGVGALFLLATLPPLGPTALVTVLLAVVGWKVARLRPLAFAAVGFLWAQINACQLLCTPFPESLVHQDVELVGRIAGLPSEEGDRTRFLFQVERARSAGSDIGFEGLVRLTWYRNAPDIAAGERWRLVARLKTPHGFANPGGLDYERWLFQQGIKATGYVRQASEHKRLGSGPGIYLIDRWRQRLRGSIQETLGDSSGEALLRALVLGDRSGLSSEQWDILTRTGTNHLIAISGLHVGIVAGFLFYLARWVWSRSAGLTLVLAAPRAAAIVALSGAAAYSALAGFAVSTQRALIMLSVVLGAVVLARTIRPLSGITLALAGVLILDPKAVLSYGFWLSFGAVALLIYALGQRPAAARLWSQWGKAQWVIALGLLPLLLFAFGRASVVAPLVNLIAVPLFSLVLLPLVLSASLLGLIPGMALLLVLGADVLEWAFGLLRSVSEWTWATTTLSWRPGWVWAAALVGVVLLLAPRGLPGRWLGLVFLLPLALMQPPAPALGEAKFSLLDVGQGLAATVRTARHVLVYDTGPRFPSGFNTGDAVVLPYLRNEGVSRIDTLVISHGDRDHAGGFRGLQGGISIGRILAGEPRKIPDAAVTPCVAGDRWRWDGVDFEILYPTEPGQEGNNSSCVLRVSTLGASLLLTGDMDHRAEDALLQQRPKHLKSTILVAGHHGSATSTSATFLAAVAPRFVLYAAGFANRFGFPAASVRQRVSAQGAVQLDTTGTGAIEFRLGITVISGPYMYRREKKRLWMHQLPDGGASY